VVHFEPLGVILAIMPWNFPLWQAFRAAIPALVAGNGLVLKHASNVSGCALAIAAVVRAAGLPRDLLQVLLVSGRDASALIGDARIRGVTLTGSTEAGRAVAALAGAALKPAVLELGGSDPYLIFEDADLDAAAECCAAARLVNNGQSCVAAKRFIVARRIQAAFAQRLAERLNARRVGDPRAPDTDLGPLAREDLRRSLHRQVTASVAGGARLLTGGVVPRGPGSFYPPTLLSQVPPGTPAFADELFGPVAAVIPARTESEALRLAHATPFGLGAAVFTQDPRSGSSGGSRPRKRHGRDQRVGAQRGLAPLRRSQGKRVWPRTRSLGRPFLCLRENGEAVLVPASSRPLETFSHFLPACYDHVT
jgi:succinate-semialdehyde dehydrogenase/glutarate-semialdehyde dehydrogenase